MDIELRQLHAEIDACTVCEAAIPNLRKPHSVERGEPGRVAVFGEGPGNHEHRSQKAFSGPTGKRLDQWLMAMGASPEDPRAGIYTTSITKCVKLQQSDLPTMIANCRSFTRRQAQITKPDLIITLGSFAFSEFSPGHSSYGTCLATLYHTSDVSLFTQCGFHYYHLVLPHPSPLNRWHNDPAHQLRLLTCLQTARDLFRSLT